jgi:hypothetical protein
MLWGHLRNVEGLPMKATGNKWSQPKREVMCPSPWEHTSYYQRLMLNKEVQNLVFACWASVLLWSKSFLALFLFLWEWQHLLCQCILSVTCFWLYRDSQFALTLRRDFEFELLLLLFFGHTGTTWATPPTLNLDSWPMLELLRLGGL